MNKVIIVRTLLLILIILSACNKIPFLSHDDDDDAHRFAIYFLKDDTLKIKHVINQDINDLELASSPWISDQDIRYYDWSSHCIYLKKDKTSIIPGWKNKLTKAFPEEWSYKPFVVVANGTKCYMGYFERAISIFEKWWHTPYCSDMMNIIYPVDVLFIEWPFLYRDNPQDNPLAKKALIEAGLYHGGIEVYFDTLDYETMMMVENACTTTISYKITITNQDQDALYILDPDKCGSDNFHYYNNGPTFYDLSTEKTARAEWRNYPSLGLDYWNPDWYTRIIPGESIKRRIELKGYPKFPCGEFLFEYRYNGNDDIEKEIREISDGRFWIGPTRSNILVWTYCDSTDNVLTEVNDRDKIELKKTADSRLFKPDCLLMDYLLTPHTLYYQKRR
ncbi:MAG: hypothetical protein KBA26_05790 [Candidatus Delongbacteria bacterium]|nr:hypothetical protein [Candidatus Delongbacteria bacterium]